MTRFGGKRINGGIKVYDDNLLKQNGPRHQERKELWFFLLSNCGRFLVQMENALSYVKMYSPG